MDMQVKFEKFIYTQRQININWSLDNSYKMLYNK